MGLRTLGCYASGRGLKLEPSPYVKIKSSKLFCSPILSWPNWRCGLKLEPKPVCVDERPFVLFSHLKLAHAHLFVLVGDVGLS